MSPHFHLPLLLVLMFAATDVFGQDTAPPESAASLVAPAPSLDAPAAAGAPPATETVADSAATPPMLEPMDSRLLTGSYGIYTGDAKETEQTAARVGIVDGVLYLLAAKMKGHIHNPAVPEQVVAVPLANLRGVGLKKFGFNRQIHIDFGDRRAVMSLSGGAFVDKKGTIALYDALVAAGVPVFEPKRFVGHPYRQSIYIQY
jgi:hypothetical protein